MTFKSEENGKSFSVENAIREGSMGKKMMAFYFKIHPR